VTGLPADPAAREPCTQEPCGRAAGQKSPPARSPYPAGPEGTRTARPGDQRHPAAPARPGGQAPPAAPVPGSPLGPPGREPGTPSPAGGALDADGASPAGSSGEQFRQRWKTARAARNYGRRRQAGRYVRQADRTAGQQWRPGMGRRPPPGGDEAA
jgi:hypothetical protein